MWIDFLCINQLDLEEKTRHISLMSMIFDRASRVGVWLGELTPWGRIGLDFVASVARSPFTFSTQLAPGLMAFSGLLRNPWFLRHWTVNDVALAKTVTLHLGTETLDWETFASAVRYTIEFGITLRTRGSDIEQLPVETIHFFATLSDQAAPGIIDLLDSTQARLKGRALHKLGRQS
jgi:Heterokaryon incompatibility protein (HET)